MTISGANGSEATTTHGATVPSSGPNGAPAGVVVEELSLDAVHHPLDPARAVAVAVNPQQYSP